MTIPITGPIKFSDFSVEVGQPTTYSASMSWIVSVTKPTQVPSPPNVNAYRGYSYYQRNADGACNNGNCTVSGGNCGNINCVNCYISGTVNCTNCDATPFLQTGTNCVAAYNCTSAQFSVNCNCDCDCNCAPPPACDCACACDCAPPPACACDCAPPPPADCACDCACACDQCTCFPAGSLVLLYNLKWKLIEEITIDDILMGADGNPTKISRNHTTTLGDRRLMSFAEEPNLMWSDEHPFWARYEGKQWLWIASHKSWIKEVHLGVVTGLKDNNSFLPRDTSEFATLKNGFDKRTVIDVTDEKSEGFDTKLYLPIAKSGSFIIVNGYVVSGGTNEFLFDYTKFDWNTSRNIINTMIEGDKTK